MKHIKTKNGYKIKYPNGTTAYFYPNGTGKRKTKNSAYTGVVKYNRITYGTIEYTKNILTNLYTAGLNAKEAMKSYNNYFRRKIDLKIINKEYRALSKQHIERYDRFNTLIKDNKKNALDLKTYKKTNKFVRKLYMQSALIKTSDGVKKLNMYNIFLTKKGYLSLNLFRDYKLEIDYNEGSSL